MYREEHVQSALNAAVASSGWLNAQWQAIREQFNAVDRNLGHGELPITEAPGNFEREKYRRRASEPALDKVCSVVGY